MEYTKYEKCLDIIYQYTNLEIHRERSLAVKNMKLDKIGALLDKFHNPHNNQKIVHLAGSKGKGSTSYMLSKMLISEGYKVGLYTSPHIFEVSERIQINGVAISKDDFVAICEKVFPCIDEIIQEDKYKTPTFFDILTAISFIYFAEEKCDYWIIETGLGGRLDSTNIVNPILTIITSISLEHKNFLGNTLSDIAYEKAGIIKPQVPVIIGEQEDESLKVITKKAYKEKSPIYYMPDNLVFNQIDIKEVKENAITKIVQEFEVRKDKYNIVSKNYSSGFNFSLLGEYQKSNLAMALFGFYILTSKKFKNFDLFYKMFWPARMNVFEYNSGKLIIDGAHNGASSKVLIDSLINFEKKGILKNSKNVAILGIMKDKEFKDIFENILDFFDIIVFIEPDMWKDCKISNYIDIYEKIKPNKQILYKLRSDFSGNGNYNTKILDNCFNYKVDINKIKLLDFVSNIGNKHFGSENFNIVATGSLYTSAIVLKDYYLNH